MISTGGAFLASAIRTATPLALAALGELVVERAGVINISLEGVVLFGAFGALVGATHGGVAGGIAAGLGCGVLTAVVFAVFAVGLRADQIITGTAVTLLAFGATGTLYRAFYGAHGAALSIPTTGPVPIPVLANIPVVGPGLFDQPAFTYIVYLLIPLLWWWMYRRGAGLSLRAIGESPAAARAAGVAVGRFRSLAILFGGAAGGLAGVTLRRSSRRPGRSPKGCRRGGDSWRSPSSCLGGGTRWESRSQRSCSAPRAPCSFLYSRSAWEFRISSRSPCRTYLRSWGSLESPVVSARRRARQNRRCVIAGVVTVAAPTRPSIAPATVGAAFDETVGVVIAEVAGQDDGRRPRVANQERG